MKKRLIPITLVCVLVVSLCGCFGCGSSGEASVSVGDLVELAQESAKDIQSCNIEADVSMEMSIPATQYSEAQEASMSLDLTGALDIPNEQLQLVMNMDMPAEVTGTEMEGTISCYLVGDSIYLGMPGEESGSTEWMTMSMPNMNMISMMGLTEQQLTTMVTDLLACLESSADIVVEGSEQVKGVDCYYVEIDVNVAQLMNVATGITENPMIQGFAGDMGDSLAEIEEAVESLTVTIWLAQETGLPMKVAIDTEIEIPMESMTIGADLVCEVTIFDYNQPAEVQVPQEAVDNAGPLMLGDLLGSS